MSVETMKEYVNSTDYHTAIVHYLSRVSPHACSNNVARGPFGPHQELLPLAADPDFPSMRRVLVSNS